MRDVRHLTKQTCNGITYEIMVCCEHELEHCRRCFYDFRELNEMSEQDAQIKSGESDCIDSEELRNDLFLAKSSIFIILVVVLLPLFAFYMKQKSILESVL